MQRLKTWPQFQAVLAGDMVAKTEHFALHRRALSVQTPQTSTTKSVAPDHQTSALFFVHCTWVGALVPKRWAKRAVTRNAIKRQIYSVSAALLRHDFQAAFVVRLRKDFSRQEFLSATSDHLKQTVRAEMTALMRAGNTLK